MIKKKLIQILGVILWLIIGPLMKIRAQHVYQIRADSVRIYNVCDTAELIIENRTRGVAGYLYNKGNGRTEFRKVDLVQVGGSKLAIAGQDTIDLAQMSGVGGIDTIYRSGDKIHYVKQGILREVFAPLAPADTALTWQRVTDRGNISIRDNDNIILRKATTGAGGLYVQFRNSDNTERGTMGYSSTNNSFVIQTVDNAPTRINQRLLVNNPTDDNPSALHVRGTNFTTGFIHQYPATINPESNTGNQFWNAIGGAQVTPDPEFRTGTNGVTYYNNGTGGNTAVIVTRENAVLPAAVPNSSGYYLKVVSNAIASPQNTLPGLGGIRLNYWTAENKVYVTRMKALIPAGYTLMPAANAYGKNSSQYWLTSNKGTGKWEDYIHVYAAGSDTAFSTVGFYYLEGPVQSTTWYLGYYDFKISTSVAWPDNLPQNLATGRPNELFIYNDSTKLSKGLNNMLRVTTPDGYLDIGVENPAFAHFMTDREAHWFNKPVLGVSKIGVYNNGPIASTTTYLAQTEGRINNSPILTEASASGNYLMKLVDTAQSGNLWMKGGIKSDLAFTSKIAAGNASLRLHTANDVLRFGVGLANAEIMGTGADFHIWRYNDAGVTPTVAMTINRANGNVNFAGSVSMPNNSKVLGDGSGNNNYSIIGFYNNLYNRVGYVGKGANANMDIHLTSDSGNVVIYPKGGNTLTVNSVQLSYNGGTLGLNNGTSNTILFSAPGAAPPAYTTRSGGTRVVISPSISASTVDYGIGIETNHLWFSTSTVGTGFKWYAGTNTIGTFTGNGNLSVTGSMTATAFNQSSLRSLKKDIQPFNTSAISVLANAQVRTFRFKADSTQHLYIGFIADELPDEMSSNGRQGVDQASTVGLLVKAVQELKAEKDQLSAENKALVNRIQKLEAAIEKILQQQNGTK